MPRTIGTWRYSMPASFAAASMSAPRGWSGSSPSGRLLTIIVTPWRLSWGTSSGVIWPLTSVFSSSWRNIPGLLESRDRGEHRVPIAYQLRLAHALDLRELSQGPRPRLGDSAQGRIVEHDIGRHPDGGGELAADRPQRFEHRVGRALRAAAGALALGR